MIEERKTSRNKSNVKKSNIHKTRRKKRKKRRFHLKKINLKNINFKKLKLKKKIRNRLILGAGALVVLFAISYFIYLLMNPIMLKDKTCEVELGSPYDAQEEISYVFLGNKDNVQSKTNVDTSKLGTYKTTYTYGNKTKTITVEVVDRTPPSLTLKSYTTDMVEEVTSDEFIDKVNDVSTVTSEIKSIEDNGDNTYTVTIQATDTAKNTTTDTTTLTRKKDKKGPTFTSDMSDINIYENETVNYLDGVTVKDNYDKKPTITCDADKVINGSGSYTITYTATDRTGNKTTATRNVTISEIPESERKVVYLTFDDGPSSNTDKILDILAEYNCKATFFVTGNGQSYNNSIVKAYNAGHTIGLHSYTHEYSIYQSTDTYFEDLNKISDMVYNLIGIRSNIIRFPGGSSNTVSKAYADGIMTTLTNEVTAQGYLYFDWNVSSSDATAVTVDTDTIISSATSGDEDHIVLLMHDAEAKTTTVEALPTIIEYYRDKGYEFLGLSAQSPECHHEVNN